MRIVLVNHCHPSEPHVCATRFREFALALARRGHQVALLTETLPGSAAVPTPHDIAELLESGGAPSPMLVACPPARRMTLRSVRGGYWPFGFQQALIAYQFVVYGGMYSDWRQGALPYVRVLAERFHPEVVWASFGNTDSWAIAQLLARRANCPWVADIKDFWQSFIPQPLRRSLARRYRDAAARTALSHTHAEAARRWFGHDIDVIYSGFDAAAIRRAPERATDELVLTLTGSVYSGGALDSLLRAIGAWALRQDETVRKRLAFAYYGNEWRAVGSGLARVRLPIEAKAHGFLPLEELQAIHRRALANLYVTFPRTFHHKAIELLAARRPIVAFPADHVEAVDIAAAAGGNFSNCATAEDVGRALDAALAAYEQPDGPVPPSLEELTWDKQAELLEAVLLSTLDPVRVPSR